MRSFPTAFSLETAFQSLNLTSNRFPIYPLYDTSPEINIDIMDIFGTILSAGQCINTLIDFGADIASAPAEIKKLKEEVECAKALLENIDELYKRWVRERGEDSELKLQSEILENAVIYFNALVKRIQRNFSGRNRRCYWMWSRSRVIKDVEAIKSNYPVFQLSIMLMNMKLARSMRRAFDDMQQNLATDQQRSQFQAAIDWLSSFKPGGVVQELEFRNELKGCLYSEPRWIFEKKAYKDWQSESSATSNWLWGVGPQGAGKSTIASFLAYQFRYGKSLSEDDPEVVQSEQPKYANPGVAIYYCSYTAQTEQSIDTIFLCLCRQLLTQLKVDAPSEAFRKSELVEQLRDPASRVTPSGTSKRNVTRLENSKSLLKELLDDFQQPYIIIDALDEYPHNKEELLNDLNDLSSTSLRIFVTSRLGGGGGIMSRRADGLLSNRLEISPTDDDISSYVSARLSRVASGSDSQFYTESAIVGSLKDPERRSEIGRRIVSAADRSFLLAKLQINTLGSCWRAEDLQKRLDEMPRTLEGVFDESMERITAQDDAKCQAMGKRALLWTIYARRPLTFQELSHILATYPHLAVILFPLQSTSIVVHLCKRSSKPPDAFYSSNQRLKRYRFTRQ